jgi:hypothetical protein
LRPVEARWKECKRHLDKPEKSTVTQHTVKTLNSVQALPKNFSMGRGLADCEAVYNLCLILKIVTNIVS